jgi:hypothetical protein
VILIWTLLLDGRKIGNKKLNSVALVRERTIPTERLTDRSLPMKLVPTFGNRGCRVVSAMDPHGSILGFLNRKDRESKKKKMNQIYC